MFRSKSMNYKRFVSEKLNWDNCALETNGELFLLSSMAQEWRLCLDIGANRGEYTDLLLKYAPKAKIISFEPNPQAAKTIKKSPKVKIEIAAVGAKKGSLTLHMNQDDDTQSSAYRQNEHTKKVTVPQVSVDDYAAKHKLKHIDFIKIDTEGHELAVIQGMKQVIADRTVDYIQFEYGGTYKDAGTLLKQVYELLQDNYAICQILSQGFLQLDYSKDLETYRYSNWLAISRNIYKEQA